MLGGHISALDECGYINANDCITARLTCTTAIAFRPDILSECWELILIKCSFLKFFVQEGKY